MTNNNTTTPYAACASLLKECRYRIIIYVLRENPQRIYHITASILKQDISEFILQILAMKIICLLKYQLSIDLNNCLITKKLTLYCAFFRQI
jgi:ABC-type multidrug transport system permease subunit